MTPILIVVLPLVVLLLGLIVYINQGEHYAPQAYYRRKTAGAPIVFEFDSLQPRPRRRLPELPEDPPRPEDQSN